VANVNLVFFAFHFYFIA